MTHIFQSILFAAFLFSTVSSIAQTFKPHIGLNDRLMNSFLLCDRSVTAKDDAWYGWHDVEGYNREYDKMVICSKSANKVALNKVLKGEMSCKKAEAILFSKGLTCQIETDNLQSEMGTQKMQDTCRAKIQAICEQFLIEKNIRPKKLL